MTELPDFDRAVAIDPDGEGRWRGGLPADGDSAALRARIAVGPHQGQKAFTLQMVPARAERGT